MTRLSPPYVRLDDRLTAEFLAHSVALLAFPFRQSDAQLNAAILRLDRPEAPRDPDLPILPPKNYPRPDATLIDAAARALIPPPAPERIIGYKAELDEAVLALLGHRPVVLLGSVGSGKTTLLRQLANDPRIRKHYRRVWWLDAQSDADAWILLGLALNAPHVLVAEEKDRPALIRDMLTELSILLIVDGAEQAAPITKLAPNVAVSTRQADTSISTSQTNTAIITLKGLTLEAATGLLGQLSGYSASQVRPLAAQAGGLPLILELLTALMVEDGITPEALNDFLKNMAPEENKLQALYAGSLEALPDTYRALCQAFAASPRRWIAVSTILQSYDKPLVGQRSITFLEKRHFIERQNEAVRVIGNWAENMIMTGEVIGFAPILPVTANFRFQPDDDPATIESRELHEQGLTLINEVRDGEAEVVLNKALMLRQNANLKYGMAETLSALARLAYLGGDDAVAIRLLEAAAEHLHELRDERSLEIIRLALSRAYRRVGRLDAALSVLGDHAPTEDFVAIYRARHDWPEAIAACKRWMEEALTPSVARAELAEIYLSAGQYAEALTVIAQDDNFAAEMVRAMVYHSQNDLTKALSIYSQISIDAPHSWRGILARAMARALAAQGEVQQAAMLVGAEGIWYEAKQPRPVFARQRRSQALFAQLSLMAGHFDQARQAANMALSLTGERPDKESEAIANRVLGRLLWQQGDYSGAQKAFENELAARGSMPFRDEHEIGVTLHNIADVQMQQGEADRAIANYRRALTHKDSNQDLLSVALTLLALRAALLQVGRHSEVLEVGQQAVELLTRNKSSNKIAAVDLQILGYTLSSQADAQYKFGRKPRGDTTLSEWIDTISMRREEALSHTHWGVILLASGLHLRCQPPIDDPIGLIDLAEKALALAEANTLNTFPWAAWSARRDLGQVYLRLERWSEAGEVLLPLLDIPTDAARQEVPFVALSARLGLARAAVKLDDIAAAVHYFEDAVQFEPDQQAAGLILCEVADTFRATSEDTTAAAYYQKALEFLQYGSISIYVETLITLAYTRLRLRRFNDAIDTFQDALSIVEKQAKPDTSLLASVLFEMASAHSILGQHRRAAERYQQSLKYQDSRHHPQHYAETLLALAQSQTAVDNDQAALQAYHEALQLDVLTPDQRRSALTEQGSVFARTNQQETAIRTYQAALQIDGGSALELATIHRGLGTSYATLNDFQRAKDHFQQVLTAVRDDHTGPTLHALGDSYRAQGQLEDAITAYDEAIQYLDRAASPVELAAVERAVGEIYLEMYHPSEALPRLEKALEIERALPQQNGGRIVSTLQSLAAAHELRGEREKAAYRHHEALVYQDVRHAPEQYAETLLTLGRLYMALNQYRDAAKAYEEALNTLNGISPESDQSSHTDRSNKIDAATYALAEVYRAWGRLERARDLYREVVLASGTFSAQAKESLQTIEAEIARHLQTLALAEQSWTLLNRAPQREISGLVFVRATQAHTLELLGRWENSTEMIGSMVQLLRDHRVEIAASNGKPILQALVYLLEGVDHEEAGEAAVESYQRAIAILERDPKSNAALVWAIQRKTGQK